MKIILVDLIVSGHHPTYLNLYSKILLELGHEVKVFFPKKEVIHPDLWSHQNFSFYPIKCYSPNTYAFPLYSFFKVLFIWIYLARQMKKYASREDVCFFMKLDFLIYESKYSILNRSQLFLIHLFFKNPWGGILFGRQNILGLEPNRSTCTLDNCRNICVLDDRLVMPLQKLLHKPIFYLPDATVKASKDYTSTMLEEIRTQAKERKIIGLLGALQKRKGLLNLMSISEKMPPQSYYFMFIGEVMYHDFNPDELARIKAYMNHLPENVFFHPYYIPDEEEFNGVGKLADVLYAVYLNFSQSSGVLTKAAQWEIPLVVSTGHLMEQRVSTYELGLAVDEHNLDDQIQAMETLCFQKDSLDLNFNFDAYNQAYSVSKLQQQLEEVVHSFRK